MVEVGIAAGSAGGRRSARNAKGGCHAGVSVELRLGRRLKNVQGLNFAGSTGGRVVDLVRGI